jgi:putative membrane protein
MKKPLLVLAVLCLSIFSACEPDRRTAQGDGYRDTTATDGRSATDARAGELNDDTREFLTSAASGGMMEVELGRIVQQKATRQEVKDFAAMMVKDHSLANDRLKAIAQNKNIQLPQQMEEDHQKEVNRFRDMQAGQDFDREYVNLMVEDHEEDIEKFESAQGDVQDSEILQWINNTLPTLRTHKERIDQIKASMDKRR